MGVGLQMSVGFGSAGVFDAGCLSVYGRVEGVLIERQMCAWCEEPQGRATLATGYVHRSVGILLSHRDLCYPLLKV